MVSIKCLYVGRDKIPECVEVDFLEDQFHCPICSVKVDTYDNKYYHVYDYVDHILKPISKILKCKNGHWSKFTY